MSHRIKVAVIGGTGKSGSYLVKGLLDQDFPLRMLVKDAAMVPHVEAIAGDARHYADVRALVQGCQAVISTLGQRKGEPPIFSVATTNVIRAMEECGLKRYIVTTGLNVDSVLDSKGPKAAFATEWMKTNYPQTTADKQRELEILLSSDVDWTLVRLPLINLTDERGRVDVCLYDCPGDRIGAVDLADFLIAQLSTDAYSRRSPFIASV